MDIEAALAKAEAARKAQDEDRANWWTEVAERMIALAEREADTQ